MSSSLHLSTCIPSDAAELAQTHLAAFMSTPLHTAVMGNCPPELLQQRAETSFRKGIIAAAAKETNTQQQQTSSHHLQDEKEKKYHLKVTDTATSSIAAYAIWTFLPNGYRPENFDSNATFGPLPEGGNHTLWRDACETMARLQMCEPKRTTEGHWLLNVLGTHP